MGPAQTELCKTEVESLLDKGAIVESFSEGFISGIFLIPKKSGGYRPIINLKGLNQFLTYRHFKLEGFQTVRHTVKRGDWMCKLDLRDAYITVPMAMSSRQFLHFKLNGKIFEFVSLPF